MLKSSKPSKSEGEARETEHYCYICVKKHDADRMMKINWDRVVEEVLKEQAEEDLALVEGEEEEQGDEDEEDRSNS